MGESATFPKLSRQADRLSRPMFHSDPRENVLRLKLQRVLERRHVERQMQIKDGSLDMLKLMKDWQKFWRKDGHLAAEGFGYRESGPHLMLMAFLQRVINGGGSIQREYGLGRGALEKTLPT